MREIIEQKLTELSAQKEELLARLNAVIGAEQVLKDILGKEDANHKGHHVTFCNIIWS